MFAAYGYLSWLPAKTLSRRGLVPKSKTITQPNARSVRKKASSAEVNAEVVRGWLFQGDECLLWPLGMSSNGYGAHVTFNEVRATPHVHVCTLKRGERPPGHDAAHECGNRRCFNGNHLIWKLHVDNCADIAKHGRVSQGEARHNSVLTVEDVAMIRKSKASTTWLAKRLGVHAVTVSDVRRGKTWKHVAFPACLVSQ